MRLHRIEYPAFSLGGQIAIEGNMVLQDSSSQFGSNQSTREGIYKRDERDKRGVGGIVDAMHGFKAREGLQDQGRRTQQQPQQQQWDSSTYSGLLNILEDSRAPIAASCAAVEECLSLNKDNLRGFFEQCFAPLVANIFGYSMNAPGQGGWLHQVSFDKKSDISRGASSKGLTKDASSSGSKTRATNDVVALRRLLAPKGKLFMAMYNADCDGTIKFHFPKQRLPRMTQFMMNGFHQMLTIWPQYSEQGWEPSEEPSKGGQQHLHVSVLQYFCYWFAFYAINSLSSNRDYGSSHFQNFGKRVLHLRGSSSSSGGSGAHRSMYLVLLRDLLHDFLPRPVDTSEDEGLKMPTISKNTLISSYQDKPGAGVLFYSVLLEFWLKDADELWLKDSKSAVSSRSWGSSYEPPGENMLAAIEELTKYVLVYQTREGNFPAQSGSAWLPISPVLYEPKDIFDLKGQSTAKSVLQGPRMLGISASIGPQAYSRQLYRMLHRALSLWPEQRTIKPLLKVIMAILAPWQSQDAMTRSESKSASTMLSGLAKSVGLESHSSSKKRGNEYTSEWEHHVLSLLPFYLDLVPLFLDLSISRVGARGETSVHDVMKILSIFEKSEELVTLLKSVEMDVNKCFASQPRRAEGPYAELIPWIIEQAENWKQFAACDASQGMSLKHTTEFGDVKRRQIFSMFSTRVPCASCSAHDILCISAGILKPSAQKTVETCFAKVLPLSDVGEDTGERDDGSMPGGKYQFETVRKIPKISWKDVAFKGNDLAKPKTSYEVPYLVDLMIALSKRLNTCLGLDVPLQDKEFPENIVQEVLYALRRKGWIVNLRPFSDVRNVVWGLIITWILKIVVISVLF